MRSSPDRAEAAGGDRRAVRRRRLIWGYETS